MKKLLLTVVLATIIANVFGTTPTTYYWVGGNTGDWTATTSWSLSRGGTAVTRNADPGDILIFDGNCFATGGNTTGTQTVTVSGLGTETISHLIIMQNSQFASNAFSTTGPTSFTVTLNASAALTITNDLIIGSNACKFDDGGSTVVVGGNLVNAGTTQGSGKIQLTGSSNSQAVIYSTLSGSTTGSSFAANDLGFVGTAWASQTYTVGTQVVSNGLLYTCTATTGSAATTAPSGYSVSNTNDANVTWAFAGFPSYISVRTVSSGAISTIGFLTTGCGYTTSSSGLVTTFTKLTGSGSGASLSFYLNKTVSSSSVATFTTASTPSALGQSTNIQLSASNSTQSSTTPWKDQYVIPQPSTSTSASNNVGTWLINGALTLSTGYLYLRTPSYANGGFGALASVLQIGNNNAASITGSSTSGVSGGHGGTTSPAPSGAGKIVINSTNNTSGTNAGTLYFENTTVGKAINNITMTSGYITLKTSISAGSNPGLNLNGGTLDDGGNTLTLQNGYQSTAANGSVVHVSQTGGAIIVSATTAKTFGSSIASSTITMGNVQISGAGAAHTLQGNLKINGILTFSNTSTLTTTGYSLTVLNGGAVSRSNTGGIIGTGTFNYGLSSGDRVDINISGTAAITSGAELAGANGGIGTLTISTTGASGAYSVTSSPTIYTGLTISGTATGALTINASQNIIMANGSTITRSGTGTIVNNGNGFQYGLGSGLGGASTDRVNIAISATVASVAELSATSGVAGAGIGTLTVSGTAVYTVAQSPTIYTGLTISSTGAGAITINSSQKITMANGSTITRSGTGTIVNNGNGFQYGLTGGASTDRVNIAVSASVTSSSELSGSSGVTGAGIGTLTVSSGTYTLASAATLYTGLTLSGGSLTGTYLLTMANNSTITHSGTGTITNTTFQYGLSGGSATDRVNIVTSATVTISATEINTFTTGTTGAGINLSVNSGTCNLSSSGSFMDITIANGATLNIIAGYSIANVRGNWSNSGFFTYATTPTVTFSGSSTFGSANQSITKSSGSETFYSLSVSKSNGTLTANSPITVSNTLTLNSGGTFNDGGNTITVQGPIVGTGSHASTGSGKISMTLAGSSLSALANIGNFEIAGGTSLSPISGTSNTYNLQSGCTFTITSAGFFTATNVKIAAADVTAKMVINGGISYNLSQGLIGSSSSYVFNNSNFTAGSTYIANNLTLGSNSTVILSNTTAQTIEALSYANLTVTGARAATSVTFGTTGIAASNGTIGISGTFDLSGTTFTTGGIIVTSSTVSYNGTGSQTITSTYNSGNSTFSYNNLVIANTTATVSASTSITASGTTTVNSGATLAISSGFTSTSTFTVNGTLQINSGGYVNGGLSPTYSSTSILKYNSGSTYGRGTEWNATSGAGYPYNIQISNNTILDLGANGGTGTARQCAGYLTIDAGSTFQMDNTNGNAMTAALTVLGSVDNEGTLKLSTSVGGDINVGGNWTVGTSGIQTNNSRAVTFNAATGNQTIAKTGGGNIYFDYLLINKSTSGNVVISSSPATDIVLNTSSGNVLQLNNTGGLDLNGRSITLNYSGGMIYVNGNRSITSSVAGGKIEINQYKAVANNSGTGALTIGPNVTVDLNANGNLDFGKSGSTYITTLNGILSLNSTNSCFVNTNPPIYGSTALLKYNSGGTYGRGVEFSTTSGAGYPANVQLSNNTTLNYPSTGTAAFSTILSISANLTVDAGSSLYMDYGANGNKGGRLSVAGDVTLNGNLSLGNAVGGDLYVGGNWSRAASGSAFSPNSREVRFNGTGSQGISNTGGETFDYLTINKASGTLTANTGITVNNDLGLTGAFADGGSIISVSGNITGTGTHTGAGKISMTGSGKSISGATLQNIELNNSGGFITTASPTINGTLTLTAGALNNSTYNISLGNGATIARADGTLNTIPTFGSSVNLTYNGANALTPANEFPAANIIGTLAVNNTNGFTLNANKTVGTLNIGSSGIMNVAAGKQLTVSTNMTNNGTLNLLSTSADGTATILTPDLISGSGTANVSQFLTGGRNWYVSSPVSGANATTVLGTSTATTAPTSFMWYDETKGSTSPWTTETSTLGVTKGYIAINPALPATQTTDGVITFSGTLNNGSISTATVNPLTLSSTGVKDGFNLVGNPYPSYLDWNQATKTNLNATMWYRTKEGSVYKFYTYNGTSAGYGGGQVGVPANVSNLIPPMQAFWVRVEGGPGSLAFTNTMRSHLSGTNPLKAKAVNNSVQPLLRLQVSNTINTDEAVVYFNANASNSLDAFDSPKMTNANAAIPEIYTTVNNENLVINGMNSIPYDTEIALGFTPGSASSFSIKASEVSNFETGTQIFLKDYATGTIQDITDGTPYTFVPDNTVAPAQRFTLLFKAASISTVVNSVDGDNGGNSAVIVTRNANNYISVNCVGGLTGQNSVAVYNEVGKKLLATQLTRSITVLDNQFAAGVYLVVVKTGGKSVTQKVILN